MENVIPVSKLRLRFKPTGKIYPIKKIVFDDYESIVFAHEAIGYSSSNSVILSNPNTDDFELITIS